MPWGGTVRVPPKIHAALTLAPTRGFQCPLGQSPPLIRVATCRLARQTQLERFQSIAPSRPGQVRYRQGAAHQWRRLMAAGPAYGGPGYARGEAGAQRIRR